MRQGKLAIILLIAVTLSSTWRVSAASGEETGRLMPRLGETTREFEARKRGQATPRPVPNSVTLVAGASGHFFVEPSVNGSRIKMMVDTGATTVSLTKDDARRIGINPAPDDFTISASTGNGIIRVAPVLLKEVVIGDISVRNVIAVVHPQHGLAHSLLGMSFLSKLSH
jgi:aspartyl protease family protein